MNQQSLVPATCTCHKWTWPNKQGVRFCKRCGMISPPQKAPIEAPTIDARAKWGDS